MNRTRLRHIFASTFHSTVWGFILGAGFSTLYMALIFFGYDRGHYTTYCTDIDCGANSALIIPITLYALGYGYLPTLIFSPIGGALLGLLISLTAHSESQAIRIGVITTAVFCIPWIITCIVLILLLPLFLLPFTVCFVASIWLSKKIYTRTHQEIIQ